MTHKDFTSAASGKIVAIQDGVAFLPNPLPANIAPRMDIITSLGKAARALGEFVGEVRQVDNPHLITHPLAMREAVLSNKIEGTHTAIAGVLLQKAGAMPADPVQRSKQSEVINYFRASELGAHQLDTRLAAQ